MDLGASAEPSNDEGELNDLLAQLGLDQYEDVLRENGFDSWETLRAITEGDMASLGFRLGDRRKLQRAIHNQRSSTTPPSTCLASNFDLSMGGLPVIGTHNPDVRLPPHPSTRSRRRYRRHPRPDHNAPRKPKTAYVLYSEHVRNDPAMGGASFSVIAKEVGRRWGTLAPEEREEVWEKPTAEKMREYKADLEIYKKTDNYRSYQTYVDHFKREHNQSGSTTQSDNNKSPAEVEPSYGFPLLAVPNQDEPQTYQKESGKDDKSSIDVLRSDAPPPISQGMQEVVHVLNSLGVTPQYSRSNVFPPESVTDVAVEAFLHGTGTLLFFWEHDEALDLLKSVYRPTNDLNQQDATELFAMAAIGSYCDGEANSMSTQENFLFFFLSLLSSPLNTCDLRLMRLFACLAICRFTNSVESARSLVLSALEIGRRTFADSSFVNNNSEAKANYWWKIFRSVVFLESWLAYNTGCESRINENDLTLYRLSAPDVEERFVTFHQRVSELGQLAAHLALDLRKSDRPKIKQAEVHFDSLTQWHHALPQPMQLSRLNLASPLDIAWHVKRSILQLHMLFLGLFVEPYRSCLVDLGRFRLSESSDPNIANDLKSMENVERQCVSAAHQSARVASLLQTDNLIRSHCWVSVYTSFTGCSVLLFSASQKLLLLAAEELGYDLMYATAHLNVLSLCSYNSGTARMLYATLQVVFNDIREIAVSPTYRAMRERHLVVKDAHLAPPRYYDAVEGAAEISMNILDVTRRIIAILHRASNSQG